MNILTGRKTATGTWFTVIAGGMHIADYWYSLPLQIATGLFMVGAGLIGYGIWSRLTYSFYRIGKDGKPDLKARLIKKPRVG